MSLPDFLAKPVFHLIYDFMRRRAGATFPLIRRHVTPVHETRQPAFDSLSEKSPAGDARVSIEDSLPYPKAEFLSYVCDWRRFVAHGLPQDFPYLDQVQFSLY